MVERLGVERVQEIVADGQSAHPRRDLEIEDEGGLHLEHNLQCVSVLIDPVKHCFYHVCIMAAARSALTN